VPTSSFLARDLRTVCGSLGARRRRKRLSYFYPSPPQDGSNLDARTKRLTQINQTTTDDGSNSVARTKRATHNYAPTPLLIPVDTAPTQSAHLGLVQNSLHALEVFPEDDAILLAQVEHHAESIADDFLLDVDVASSYQFASVTARKLTRPSSRLQY